MIHASEGVSEATLIDVEIVHFISFFLFFVSRFKKRGITTLRGGVLGLSLLLGAVLSVSLDCCGALQSRSIVVTLKLFG